MSRETKLSIPQTEQYYYDKETKTYKPLAQNGAIPVVVVGGGMAGGSSMNFLSGAGVPTNDTGLDGDVYLNSTNGDLYKKEDESWSVIANLKGAKGDKGDTGANGKDGTNGADGKNGANGKSAYQIWLDAGNEGTELDFLNSLKGAKGATGANGKDGKDGFGTEEQYNDIIARLEALESAVE